jgi:hypothetical protein
MLRMLHRPLTFRKCVQRTINDQRASEQQANGYDEGGSGF